VRWKGRKEGRRKESEECALKRGWERGLCIKGWGGKEDGNFLSFW